MLKIRVPEPNCIKDKTRKKRVYLFKGNLCYRKLVLLIFMILYITD